MPSDNNSFELFKGKTFSDLMKDIYKNSKEKHAKIEKLVDTLSPLIKNVDDATIVVPLIKEYLEVGVKNDELLVKLAGIVQRYASSNNSGNTDEIGAILSPKEKEQLVKALGDAIDDSELQK